MAHLTRRDELQSLMRLHKLNVKRTAGLLHVSVSCVYNWCNGYSLMPNRAWLQLLEKLTVEKAEKEPKTVMRNNDIWNR